MRIGLTYDLRTEYLQRGLSAEEAAEYDLVETIEGLETALTSLGHQPVRVGNIRGLITELAAGKRWDLVFNIAEGSGGIARESQVPALLEALAIPYTFSDAFTLAVALHKPTAKLFMRAAGVPTPDFSIVGAIDEVDRVAGPFPLFVKPVAEGSGKGVSAASRVDTPDELRRACALLLARHAQPVLVEAFLPGREFTVGVIGTGKRARALGVMEVRFNTRAEPHAYSYQNKAHYEDRVSYRLADDARAANAVDVALRAWRALAGRDAGRVDLRCDSEDAVQCLELNPLAGLDPRHSDLVILCRLAGISFMQLIAAILDSAMERIPS